jgi:hypothetical protein
MSVNLKVTMKGPMFSKVIDAEVKKAIVAEALAEDGSRYTSETIPQRIKRVKKSGKRQGRLVNTVTTTTQGLNMTAVTTVRDKGNRRQSAPSFGRGAGRRPNPQFNPRTKGTSWKRSMVGGGQYGKGAIRTMLPRTMKAITTRIVAELG